MLAFERALSFPTFKTAFLKSSGNNFECLNFDWRVSLILELKVSRLTRIQQVSINKLCPDLIISLSQIKTATQQSFGDTLSTISVWNIKMPQMPLGTKVVNKTVTSIDFSSKMPNVFAASTVTGQVKIFSTKNKASQNEYRGESNSFVDISEVKVQNLKAKVVSVKWFCSKDPSGNETEMIMACTYDGRIFKLDPLKNYQFSEIMRIRKPIERIFHLKPGGGIGGAQNGERDPSQAAESHDNGNFLSKQSSILSFSISPGDSNSYIVGTIEGLIHECNVKYTESQLDSKYAHTHPATQIEFCPHSADIYASCGGKTACIWKLEAQSPLLRLDFKKTAKIIQVGWSELIKGLFFVLTKEVLYIYNLYSDINEPKITLEAFNCQFTFATFHRDRRVLLIGNNDGRISMYKLSLTESNTEEDLENVFKTNVVS